MKRKFSNEPRRADGGKSNTPLAPSTRSLAHYLGHRNFGTLHRAGTGSVREVLAGLVLRDASPVYRRQPSCAGAGQRSSLRHCYVSEINELPR